MNRQIYENYVRQVVEHGNLTKAAKALGISQPALSQGLTALERDLGFQIFIRRSNPITLTPEGKIYYEHLRRIDTLNSNFEKQLGQYREQLSNRAVIGAPAVYVSSILMPSVVRLLQKNPAYEICVKTASLDELTELALRGEIDAFISTSRDLPNVFQLDRILREEIVLCVPQNDPTDFFFEQNLNPAAFESKRFICLEEELPLQISVDRFLEDAGIRPKYRLVVDQSSQAVSFVEQGAGICFASAEAARGKRVRTYPLNLRGRDIYLAYDRDLYLSPACRALIDEIKSMSE